MQRRELNDMRLAVSGVGANVAGIAADSARAGLDLPLIDQWPADVDAINERGIRVELPDAVQITPVKALHQCQELNRAVGEALARFGVPAPADEAILEVARRFGAGDVQRGTRLSPEFAASVAPLRSFDFAN